MTTIDIQASRPYQAEIGSGILPRLGQRIAQDCPKAHRAVLVCDRHTYPLHGEAALNSIRAAGLDCEPYVLPAGERTKNTNQLIKLLNYLAEQQMTRSDILVALGGGVIGDLTGFAAAVYMRGISYYQVPTTLLSAVDSSVGGKTAVDLSCGKNLMGAFWQPKGVLCDIDLLSTLPKSTFADGCAEVIKTAVLFDPELFALLAETGPSFDREAVIAACIRHKRDVVAEDEFDTGRRALLNLGHTLGHAVEACSGYKLSHGRAVAIGTATVCRAAARNGICDSALAEQVQAVLKRFSLPIRTDTPIDDLMPPMLKDKKRSGATVNVVVPEKLGLCSLRPMDADTLQAFMESGLTI